MSMSTHVVAFKPPNEKWQRMAAAREACLTAGVEVPREIYEYFGGADPDKAGVEIPERALIDCGAVRPWADTHGRSGYEIDVTNLPPDVTIVRVYNSY